MNNAPAAATRRLKKKPTGKPKLIRRRPQPPALRLTPTAWSKLLYLRDAGPTEIGGFGIASADDLLRLDDVRLLPQRCDWASVELDDVGIATFFDEQVELGRRPEQFARVWVHTHPGDSAQPSATDEETFARVFGRCDWSVMLILACGGATYGRLQFSAGPGGSLPLPVEVDYLAEFAGADQAAWQAEYEACVTASNVVEPAELSPKMRFDPAACYYDYDFPREVADDEPW